MPSQIFITGGSGFVGAATIQLLLSRGHAVRALVHGHPLPLPPHPRLHSIQGDLFNIPLLEKSIRGCDTVIHLVGIIQEKPARQITFDRIHVQGTRSIVEATLRASARRYIHMSALGARPDAPSAYHATKFKAEQFVRFAGLDYTIFRPSLIHGPHGDFMRMEAQWARRKSPPFLFMPYFAPGLLGLKPPGQLQPVFVDDVAQAFADALQLPHTIQKTYPLAGPTTLTWPQLHRFASQAITGHTRPTLPIPAWFATLLTHLLPPSLLPFNRDQIQMSLEPNTADMQPYLTDFPSPPRPFPDSLATYAQSLP